MKLRNTQTVLLFVAISIFFPLSLSYAQKDFKLKEGAAGEICLSCHEGMQELMKKPFVHSPLADGDCVGCHNPHTSNFEMMMAAPPNSSHQVAADGQCILCHDPHASENKFNLLKKGSDLCFECHETLAAKIKANKFSHPPVRENCLDCHNAHASAENIKLLSDGSPSLCLQCHETDRETFKKLHNNYPVETADCTSCHDPHGSNKAAMLYDNVHGPVAKRNCEQCHAPANSAEPFSLKSAGYETCMACHYDVITKFLNQSYLHWPLADGKNCMNCHTPHASSDKKLMRGSVQEVCGKCHADTLARQERSATKHPPIAEGNCGDCHQPHSSDYQFMMKDDSLMKLCADCHDWQTHTTHPIGEEFVDPRNKNLTVQCSSCHRTHGTEYKHFLYFSTANELCVQCHARFRR
jgi:predicted CXXCH cytochrome family protein